MSLRIVICTLQELFEKNMIIIKGTEIKGQLSISEYRRSYL